MDPAVGASGAFRRRLRRTLSIILLIAVIAMLLAAAWLGTRVLTVRTHLDRAVAESLALRDALRSGSIPADPVDALADEAEAAAAAAGDPVWRLAETVPFAGRQLRAVRVVTTSLNAIATAAVPLGRTFGGAEPIGRLAPVDGVLPLDLIESTGIELATLRRVLNAASADLEEVGADDLLPQVSGPVVQLGTAIDSVGEPLADAVRVVEALPPLLGVDGPRDWLLLVQNNAEERSAGGNPAAAVVLRAEDGRLTFGRQASSQDFRTYPGGALRFDDEYERVYGTRVSQFFTSITFTPDFPVTAQLAQRMWSDAFGEQVDGVIATDPVALSYLLRAIGPITVPSGQVLTSENAVQTLLSDVYLEYPDPEAQDAVFASAARAVFDRLVAGGDLDGSALAVGAARIVDEQRFKVWSADPDEQAFLETTPVATMLPADGDGRTWIGAYTNDDSISKMSYWTDVRLDVRVDACTPAPRITVGADVENLIDEPLADTLPSYVLAGRAGIPFGGERQRVLLYGPVGSTLVGATLDGEPVRFGDDLQADQNTVADATGARLGTPAVSGVLNGRPIAVLTARIPMGATSRVTAEFTGPEAPLAELIVSHTPRHREVPVAVDRTC